MSMNVTFMIGNGFDLNLGLATKYKDFLKIYSKIQIWDSSIIQKFKKEIIKPNLELWANAEIAFGEQTTFIPNEFTVDDYCKCHSNFCEALANYLIGEQKRLVLNKENASIIAEKFSNAVNNLTVGFRAVQSSAIDSLISSYGSLIFHFIDFNYTDILDRICMQTNKSFGWGLHGEYKNAMGQFSHVHGTVEQSMVLGVHDETQISNLEAFNSYDEYYLAQLIKSRTDAMNEENTYKQALKILNSSDIIYIYGMSIGETDKLWWESICRLLNKKSTLRVIIHSFEAPKDELLRGAIKRFEDAQKNKLFDFGNVDKEQRASIQSRVHITGANIFEGLNNFVTQNDRQAKAS